MSKVKNCLFHTEDLGKILGEIQISLEEERYPTAFYLIELAINKLEGLKESSKNFCEVYYENPEINLMSMKGVIKKE